MIEFSGKNQKYLSVENSLLLDFQMLFCSLRSCEFHSNGFSTASIFLNNKVTSAQPCVAYAMLKCVGADAEKRMSRHK